MVSRKRVACCILVLVAIFSIGDGSLAKEEQRVEERIRDAVLAIREIKDQPDAEGMISLLRQAKGVAIFPSVIKVGFGLGGQYGTGILLSKDEQGDWYGPSFIDIKGISYGWQIGYQSVALVMVIANERGMENFKDGNLKLGGDISIAAGPMGRRGEVGTDLKLESSVYSYSMARGLFAGISLDGSLISNEQDMNRHYWGRKSANQIFSEKVEDPRVLALISEIETLISSTKPE